LVFLIKFIFKKPNLGESSLISKTALFQQWVALMKQIKPETSPPTIYCDAKQLAIDYQTAKIQINKAFQKAGLGLWIVCID
jgi:hypothetical protein